MSRTNYVLLLTMVPAILVCVGFVNFYMVQQTTNGALVAVAATDPQHNTTVGHPTNYTYPTSYTYTLDNGKILTGRPFSTEFLPPETRTTFVDMKNRSENFLDFTFVTGCDLGHFRESKDMVASVQSVFPGCTVYYYDLGLNMEQVKELSMWKNVIYRKFNFSSYPPHIKTLHTYGFKPLIVYEMLQDHEAVFWLDASLRMMRRYSSLEHWRDLYNVALASGGVVQFVAISSGMSGRDIYQCTHHGMFRYLPGDKEKMKKCDMFGSGLVLYHATPIIYQIVRFWALCGLTKECMAPTGASLGGCDALKPGRYACHRFDQSALGILLQNHLNYTNQHVGYRGQALLEVVRGPTNYYKIQKVRTKILGLI